MEENSLKENSVSSPDPKAPESNWTNLDIKHLIYEREGEFIVFIDSEIDVDWKTTPVYDDREKIDHLCPLHKILDHAAIIECIPNDHHDISIRLNLKRMIGEGIARALDHDYENATVILDKAENYINNRNIETARLWQLSSSTVGGIIFASVGILLWSLRRFLLFDLGDIAFFGFLAVCAGAVGANLSFIFRIGRTQITSEAPRKLHILEAFCRLIGGGISGFLISFLVMLGVLIPVFKNTNNSHLAMITAALIAGASERWAPSIIAKIENSTAYEKEKLK